MAAAIRIYEAQADDITELIVLAGTIENAPRWSVALWHAALSASTIDPEPLLPTASRTILIAREIAAEAQGTVAIVGFIALQVVAGVAAIESLGVAPGMRRQGVGRALCVNAIEWARSQRAQAMELEVRASNAVAVSLYIELGFLEQGLRRDYYHEPLEDAILMARAL